MTYCESELRKVTIAIPTFRRPDLLAKLFSSLPARIEECGDAAYDIEVLVVDNDPDGSAREVAERSPLLVRYVVEPTPGIAAARNRLLDESQTSDLIAFIDDDEVPRIGWLSSLLDVWQEHRPAAVMGRVISIFDGDVDPWIIAFGAFRRPPHPTGTVLPVAAAGNLLLDMTQIRNLGIRFDESLGLAGGEDTLFSRELTQLGGEIRWCNESETEDLVVAKRLTRTWAKQRAFSLGNAAGRISLILASSRRERGVLRLVYFFGGAARIGIGYVRNRYGKIRKNLSHDARGVRLLYRGRGMVAAAFGRHYNEYQR